MNRFKPTGGWMGTLGEGEPNTVGRAEHMACVVAAGIGVGPHHDLGKVATPISGGECLEP